MGRKGIKIVGLVVAMLMAMTVAPRALAGDERQTKVSAATSAAIEGIVQDICSRRIGPDLTVRELIARTDSLADLRQAVALAQQIGGPRWIDEQTCQIHLEISGSRIVPVLVRIAQANPGKSPIDGGMLAVRIKDWDTQTFGATGSSTGAAMIELVRPSGTAWAGVSDAARRRVIAQARQNAIQRVIDSVRPIELKPDLPLATLLDKKESSVGADLRNYLVTRPATSVKFTDSRQVELTLAAPAQEVFEVVHWAAAQPPLAVMAYEDAGWEGVRRKFLEDVAPAVGLAGADEVNANPAPAVPLPSRAPAWASESLQVEGVAMVGDSKLKIARAAETDAVKKLDTLVGDLPLGGMSLAEAAVRDPYIAEAWKRAVARGRLVKTEYKADGSVEARILLDLRQLWEDIQSGQ